MAAVAIWDFLNFEILTVVTAKRAKLHHCAKFRGDMSNCCGRGHLGFLILKKINDWNAQEGGTAS